jgi:hypothetical protein
MLLLVLSISIASSTASDAVLSASSVFPAFFSLAATGSSSETPTVSVVSVSVSVPVLSSS